MTTLLRYDLTTNPFPLQAATGGGSAAATLTVVASNPNPDPGEHPVTLRGLSVTLPVGGDAADLTADASNVGPVAPSGWALQGAKPGAGTVEYVFLPEAGQGVVGRRGLAFVFNNISVNTQPGTCTVTVKEGSAGDPTAALTVTKFPAGWGAVSFWVDPPDLPLGAATTLHWSGPAGATYTIEFYTPQTEIVNVPAPGDPPLVNQGQYPAQGQPPLTLDQTTVFTLAVSDDLDGEHFYAQEQKTATVAVGRPDIKSFTASPTFVTPGQQTSVTLSWLAENVGELHIDNVATFEGADALDGSQTFRTDAPGSYLATGYGLAGYSGPPAFAQTRVGFGGTVTSPSLVVWSATTLQPTPLWTLSLGPGRDVLAVATQVDSTDDSEGHIQNLYGTAQLAAGLEAAFLGTTAGATSYEALQQADFQPATTLARIWAAYTHNMSDDIFGENEENAGYTWGVKFPDGSRRVVWFQGATKDGDNYGAHNWFFTFGWIDFSDAS